MRELSEERSMVRVSDRTSREPQETPEVGASSGFTLAELLVTMVVLSVVRRISNFEGTDGHSSFYGVTAGFATTVANAAGPVMSMYLLASRLKKENFIATGAWFFLTVNLAKIPIYTWHNLYSRASLTFALMMVPAVLAGNFTGIWVVRKVPQRIFELLVIVLTAVSSMALFF